MITYYYNKKLDKHDNHEVHTRTCEHLKQVEDKEEIGIFSSCQEAIEEAIQKTGQTNFDGCYWCCRPCNQEKPR